MNPVTLIIIIGFVVLIGGWLVSSQRKLVSKDEICQNSLSQIGVQMNSRWDALSALRDLVKSYNEHEYNTLNDVIAQRRTLTGQSSADDVNRQEAALGQAMKAINVVVERYPELKANENYSKIMDSVNIYENQVRLSRMTYNDTVTKYNKIVRQFPDSIAAVIFHFEKRDYLQEPAGKTDMPSMAM